MATKLRSKFSPLKKRSDESEAGELGDHEIMNISYTSTSSSGTFKEGIVKHNNVFSPYIQFNIYDRHIDSSVVT